MSDIGIRLISFRKMAIQPCLVVSFVEINWKTTAAMVFGAWKTEFMKKGALDRQFFSNGSTTWE